MNDSTSNIEYEPRTELDYGTLLCLAENTVSSSLLQDLKNIKKTSPPVFTLISIFISTQVLFTGQQPPLCYHYCYHHCRCHHCYCHHHRLAARSPPACSTWCPREDLILSQTARSSHHPTCHYLICHHPICHC